MRLAGECSSTGRQSRDAVGECHPVFPGHDGLHGPFAADLPPLVEPKI